MPLNHCKMNNQMKSSNQQPRQGFHPFPCRYCHNDNWVKTFGGPFRMLVEPHQLIKPTPQISRSRALFTLSVHPSLQAVSGYAKFVIPETDNNGRKFSPAINPRKSPHPPWQLATHLPHLSLSIVPLFSPDWLSSPLETHPQHLNPFATFHNSSDLCEPSSSEDLSLFDVIYGHPFVLEPCTGRRPSIRLGYDSVQTVIYGRSESASSLSLLFRPMRLHFKIHWSKPQGRRMEPGEVVWAPGEE